MKKTLKILLPTAVIVAAGAAWFSTRTPASSFDGVSVDTKSPALVQRGEYLARASDCVACHSTIGAPAYVGGLKMPTPMGAIYATNITPDRQTGIGTYTLADFDRAIRKGVAKDGHRLYPAMPYPSYAKLEDGDVRALYAYFMNGVRPVRQENRKSDISWPLNMRWPLAFWNAAFAPGAPYMADALKDAQWNRGAYLVQGAGHCGACHTPRSVTMNERGLDGGSATFLSGALIDGWYAPSLRGDYNTGLARWSEQDIYQFLKTGRNAHGVVYGSMAEAFNNSIQFLTDEDLRAIAHYLKSLPGDPARDGANWRYDNATVRSLTVASTDPGARVYMAKCSFCHGADGRGKAPWIPPLAGTASSLGKENASTINVTLNGSDRVVAANVPDAYRMPAYRDQLGDRQIADVVTFIRKSWGNHGGPASPDDVRKLREDTKAAGYSPKVLPAH
ncbi:cytochrome c [Novosphingobium sp. BL-8H]|uniref:c-type cytochrome n=1 Tax=Novosphingobium sp. BL-8H TaxID=3127640 RepID=UPI00375631FF